MTIPGRINIVTLGVTDLQRSSTFYAALGWSRAQTSNEAIVWFQTGSASLGLFPYEELAADAGVPGERRPGFPGVTLAINVGTEEAVAEALEAAVAAGASLLKPAQRAEWGGISGYFADPDGYAWEVAYNPFLLPDKQGVVRIP